MGDPLKRDMDMIRELLLQIEGGKRSFSVISTEIAAALGMGDLGQPASEAAKLEYHLTLLEERGLVRFTKLSGGMWNVQHLTWAGQDFIDTFRESTTWEEAKAIGRKAGGMTLDLALGVGKAIIKSKLEEITGFKLSE